MGGVVRFIGVINTIFWCFYAKLQISLRLENTRKYLILCLKLKRFIRKNSMILKDSTSSVLFCFIRTVLHCAKQNIKLKWNPLFWL